MRLVSRKGRRRSKNLRKNAKKFNWKKWTWWNVLRTILKNRLFCLIKKFKIHWDLRPS